MQPALACLSEAPFRRRVQPPAGRSRKRQIACPLQAILSFPFFVDGMTMSGMLELSLLSLTHFHWTLAAYLSLPPCRPCAVLLPASTVAHMTLTFLPGILSPARPWTAPCRRTTPTTKPAAYGRAATPRW